MRTRSMGTLWILLVSALGLSSSLRAAGPSEAGLKYETALPAPAPSGAGPKYKIRFVLGHPNLDYFDEAARAFQTTVQDGSRGEIAVEVETAKNPWEDTAQGIPGPEVANLVAKGEAEMGHSFTDTMGSMDHQLWAFDAPFLFRDYNHLERVFEGPIGAEMLGGLRKHKLVGLAFTYSGGANMISSVDHPIREPEDLKGLRVAVFGDAIDNAWLTALGAAPVPFRHREGTLGTLAKAKAIDAATMTWRRHYRVMRRLSQYAYGNLEGSTYLVSVTYINEKFLDSLPPAYRELVTRATQESSRIERSKTIMLNAACRRRLASRGVQVVELTSAAKRRFQEALRPVYERTIEPLVGKDLIRRLREAGTDELASR